MRRNRVRLWEWTAVLAVGAMSWSLTSALLAPSKATARAPHGGGITGTKRALAPGEQPPENELLPGQERGQMLAMHGIVGRTIVAEPGGVAIGATARVYDVGPAPPPYVWSLLVRDGQDRVTVFEHTYHEQAFTVPAGEEAHPTFRDRVALPPGDYYVIVRLSSAADRVDQGGQLERAGLLVADGDRVTVPAE